MATIGHLLHRRGQPWLLMTIDTITIVEVPTPKRCIDDKIQKV